MDSIIKLEGEKPGKNLAIFCGVHGNEKAGVIAVQKAAKEIIVDKGNVFLVFANPRAIEANTRFTEKNLNRCFCENSGNTYEEKRANELMEILDQCDALLDIHSSNNPNTIPFIITDNGLGVAKDMDFKYVVTGFDDVEPGATDGYMKQNGKIGICLECGYSGDSEKNADLAYDSIIKFLNYFGAIEEALDLESKFKVKKHLHVDIAQKVTSEHFKMIRAFDDFETIEDGTMIAKDNENEYIADGERVILFGIPGRPIGAEAYILGRWQD